jgi:hypothetical protein
MQDDQTATLPLANREIPGYEYATKAQLAFEEPLQALAAFGREANLWLVLRGWHGVNERLDPMHLPGYRENTSGA